MAWFRRTNKQPRSVPTPQAAVDLPEIIRGLVQALEETAQADEPSAMSRAQLLGDEAVKKLTCWIEGQSPYAVRCGKLRDEYLKHLWRITTTFRRRGYPFEALWLRRILLETCDQTNPEVVPLATSVARAFASDSRLGKFPFWDWAFGLLIEAVSVSISHLPAESWEAFNAMLDSVRIDWGSPVAQIEKGAEEQICSNLKRIERLQSLVVASLAPDLAERLLFWKAMGQWRLEKPPFGEVRECFDELIDRAASKSVYCWCKARLALEAANGNGEECVAKEVQTWKDHGLPVDPRDTPPSLVIYFKLLAFAESVLGQRAFLFGKPVIKYKWPEDDVKRLSTKLLERKPQIVDKDQRLWQHLQPIVDGVQVRAYHTPPRGPVAQAVGGEWWRQAAPPPLPPRHKNE
jgi:hypothetical protein